MLLLGEEGKNTPRIYMILQMTMNSQGIPKKERKSWRYHKTRLQITMHSYSGKDRLKLAEKKTQKSQK